MKRIQLNAGTGMVMGVLLGALIAILVNAITGDESVWSYAIPVGLAVGLAIGAGNQHRQDSEPKES